MTITDKEIKETMLEVQSHSGLPIRTFYPAAGMLLTFKRACDFENQHLIDMLKKKVINNCMIEVHKGRRRGINPNIKSYDF